MPSVALWEKMQEIMGEKNVYVFNILLITDQTRSNDFTKYAWMTLHSMKRHSAVKNAYPALAIPHFCRIARSGIFGENGEANSLECIMPL